MNSMSEELVRIITRNIDIRRMYVVDERGVWIPGLDNESRSLAKELLEILEEEGYSIAHYSREYSGCRIEIYEAESVEWSRVMEIQEEEIDEREATWDEYP